MPVRRTYYGNLATGQVIAGNTQHGESLTDMEGYALPMEQARLSALLDPGVADGLQVGAALGQPGLTVGTGVAVDGRGRTAVLAVDGAAVVDQYLPGDQLRNVPTIPVTASGAQLPTDGIDGVHVLSIVSREVLVTGSLGQNPELVHAPWLRLEPASTWTGDDQSVPLATVTLDQAGAVTALIAERRLIATTVGTSVTRFPTATPGQSPVIGQATGAGLRPLADGGLQLVRKAPDGTVGGVLTVEGATGDVGLPGRLAVGTVTPASVVTLHVEGAEVHSGGSGAGFSFMDRHVPGFVGIPTGGQRWVWYAQDGSARLWSGHDQLTVGTPGDGGGLDVPRRMRVRQGADASAGIWLRQNGSGDAGFLGMRDDTHVGMWGTRAGWALVMDVGTGRTATTGPLDVGAGTRADLHVSGDAVIGVGGNGGTLTARHVNGKAVGHDGDDDLYLNWGTGRGVHVGGAAPAPLTVHGNAEVDGDLRASRNLTVAGRQLQIGGTPPLPGWSGGGLLTLDVFASGALYVGSDFDNPSCAFYADGTKHFVIDHPLDPENKSLHHVCVEGPEAAVYYRGSARLADGRTEVELPPYFEALARTDGRTVMLTPVCDGDAPISVLAASPVRGGRFTVRAADDRNPAQRFCWEVKAVRADVELLAVETAKAGREAMAVG